MRILEGDCVSVMSQMVQSSIDAIVTDPPYHLTSIVKRFGASGEPLPISASQKRYGGNSFSAVPQGKNPEVQQFNRLSRGFMGKTWDGGDVAFRPETWAAALRVLKPGGHLVAFGAPKNYHRLACAIEDAGFEIRDSLMWVFGSGFPKSLDVSKAIDKAAGIERRVVGTEKVRDIRNGHGRGQGDGIHASNRDGPVYMERELTEPGSDEATEWQGWGTALKPAYEPILLARKPLIGTVAETVLAHGTGALNIDGCRVGTEGGTKGCDAGPSNGILGDGLNGSWGKPVPGLGRWPANLVHDGSEEVLAGFPETKSGKPGVMRKGTNDGAAYGAESRPPGTLMTGFGDEGSAARFFYCAKAGKNDRAGSKHPTVKPIALMRWLVRLITPPGGVVLDPFAGSGTTGQAALEEGFDAVLIEREAEYLADIRRRLGVPSLEEMLA